MLRGGFGRPEVWREVTALLAPQQLEVFATTGPSWGSRRDEPVRPFTAAEMADDIAAQVTVRGHRVNLVGFSMGGVVAFELALTRRLPLASLTLVEATLSPLLLLASLNRYAAAAARDGMMESQRRYIEAELASLTVPTVAVHGSQTRPRLRHIAEAVVRFVPNGQEFVIEDANHDMLVTHPGQVAAAIMHAVRSAGEEPSVR